MAVVDFPDDQVEHLMSGEYLQHDDEQRVDLDQSEVVPLEAVRVDERLVLVPHEQAVHEVPDDNPRAVSEQAKGSQPVEDELVLAQIRLRRSSSARVR